MLKKLLVLILVLIFVIPLSLIILMSVPFVPLTPNFSIQTDGSLQPSNLPIERNGNLYTFMDDIQHQVLTVKKSNIIIEGNGHSSGPIILDHVKNVTILNLNIESSRYTIFLDHSSNNKIYRTTQNNHPVSLSHSHNNIISENNNLAVWLTD